MNVPLIWTTQGNVPLDTLDVTQEWDNHIESIVTLHVVDGAFQPKVEQDGYMVFIEKYHDRATGELVKESRHVCVFKGLDAQQEQGFLQ